MAGNAHAPRVAFAGQFDARAWSGITVYTRAAGATNVACPTGGVYDDPLAFLHGYGSQAGRDLQADMRAAWVASGALGLLSVGINSGDKLYIQVTDVGAGATSFVVSGAATAAFGFPNGGAIASSLGRVTAPLDWVRGPAIAGSFLTITPNALAGFACPTYGYGAQSVITLVRSSTLVDSDSLLSGVASSLTTNDCTAIDNTNRRVWWYVDDDGHVVCARATSGTSALAWVSTSFRDRLGYNGTEVETTASGCAFLRATYPLPGLWVPSRPLRRCRPWYAERTATLDLTSGGMTANHIARWSGWDVEAWASGGALGSASEERHVRDRFWRYIPLGFPVTFFQQWGDPRRARPTHEITLTDVAYDLLWTSERDGRRGRLRCYRSGTDEAQRRADYEGDGVEGRQLIAMSLRDRV